jgi:hypothetical protein
MTTNSATRTATRRNVRTLVWVLIVLCAAANAAINIAGLSLLVGSAFGLVTVVGGTWLAVDHFRNR